ncbi:hypothetical protein DY000_02028135 [Brassica cretica]|uniref:Uncharacterized protein n=1 Tax=Brassica cretica TaxID=69181 RepID=A0ABQ7EA56_BRACR|nr:hypothetical protein DY000_02028135 [Brassica cretica]
MTRSGNPDLRYGGIKQCGVQKEYQNIKLSLVVGSPYRCFLPSIRNLGTTSSSVAASLLQSGRLSSKLQLSLPSQSWDDTLNAISGSTQHQFLAQIAWQAVIYETWRKRNHRLHRGSFSSL